MSHKHANFVMSLIEQIMRDVPQAKREKHVAKIKEVATQLELDASQYDFFKYNVTRWPRSTERHKTEIRFHVDFAFGDNPDHQLYGATFEEVRALLGYSPESCRVAFNSVRGNKVERISRPTRLGPCVVTKLAHAVDPARHPGMKRLSDREAARALKGWRRGNKYEKR